MHWKDFHEATLKDLQQNKIMIDMSNVDYKCKLEDFVKVCHKENERLEQENKRLQDLLNGQSIKLALTEEKIKKLQLENEDLNKEYVRLCFSTQVRESQDRTGFLYKCDADCDAVKKADINRLDKHEREFYVISGHINSLKHKVDALDYLIDLNRETLTRHAKIVDKLGDSIVMIKFFGVCIILVQIYLYVR